MGKATGFLEYSRTETLQRQPAERVKDWNEIRMRLDPHTMSQQGARCMNCGVAFCQSGLLLDGTLSGCPLHNLIPEWNELVYQGQWQEAYQRLIRTDPFPEFTARVCPAPCEGACTVGYIMEPVAINNLEYEIIERAFQEGWVRPIQRPASGYTVAVVGSGPAGLSAAHYLNLAGHQVTVYERDDRPGGLLMYGIPNMKLDKAVIARRVELMQSAGIEFILDTEIGQDLGSRELVAKFDAVLLCMGAGKARNLSVEGQHLQGVHMALEYLTGCTRQLLSSPAGSPRYIDARGKDVIVIGGGDTGTDCVASAIRQGCRSVRQFEIMPQPPDRRIKSVNPWPEWPRKLKTDYGQAEAIALSGADPRQFLLSTTKIEGTPAGQVRAVHTVEVNWFKNRAGLLEPMDMPGSEKIWPADLVLLALGFLGPEDPVPDELDLNRDGRGNVAAQYGSFATNAHKVFAAGDMRRGPSLVVWAMQEGKLAAREIDQYLTGHSMIR